MKTIYLILIIIIFPTIVFAQNDSLTFTNSNVMVGEIKSMDRGVVVVETDYSDSDFNIEWAKIKYINTQTEFMVTISDGRKYYGRVVSTPNQKINIVADDMILVECEKNDIVFLGQFKKKFLDRLYASIDIGFSLTKANNLRQLNSRSSIGYRAQKWSTDASLNTLLSTQDEVEPIERSDGKIDYRYVLPRRWYAIATISLATNTEQRLDLRINAQLGLGRFFIRTNSAYWGANLGVNRNVERYSNETADRNSWEGYLGTQLNLYDIGDFSLLTSVTAYPGITSKERFRSDFTLDTKYDLPYDLYIKMGLTINYDNRPAADASELDYVFQTGFGWEW